MASVVFEPHGAALSEATLAALEKQIGCSFPADYRTFLLTINGGRPHPQQVFIKRCDGATLVDVLLGVGTTNDLSDWIAELAEDLPLGLIPIGFDPGGNVFLMSLAVGNSHKIYYWDSARHFATSTDEVNTYEVANSFTEFLDMLS